MAVTISIKTEELVKVRMLLNNHIDLKGEIGENFTGEPEHFIKGHFVEFPDKDKFHKFMKMFENPILNLGERNSSQA